MKINKETLRLNDTSDQMNLREVYRTLHPAVVEYTFFSNAYGTFSRRDHMLGHTKKLYFLVHLRRLK